ncbi:2036_t:CDS:2 [Dentiscutata erythropus]|uniref:2036_t:CDS:1 n=1 Tax=Dentiscutata erythropus TaxID=1348616 RepID=A0A9N9IHE5_9GLOM|nr:2036_t:CDS:2 [Dentiscutata erythropus]
MSKNFDEYYKLFYHSRNSLFEANFKRHWAQFVEFIESFPKATQYVLGTLYPAQARYARINEQKNTNPTISLPYIAGQYFPTIDPLIQEQQLSESFLYEATELSFNWNKDFSEPENVMKNGCIEDDYERCQMGLRLLLQTLKCKDVLQI